MAANSDEHILHVHKKAIQLTFGWFKRFTRWCPLAGLGPFLAIGVPHLPPYDPLSVFVTVSSARRDWFWEGRLNSGSPWRSSGKHLSLVWVSLGWESNFTRTKRLPALSRSLSAWMRDREAVNKSEYGDHSFGRSFSLFPMLSLIISLFQCIHSSVLSKALRVRTSRTRPPRLLSSSSCECSHGRGPQLHCSLLLHWSTDTLKPLSLRLDPIWHTNLEVASSTSGGLSRTTWRILQTLEKSKLELYCCGCMCLCVLVKVEKKNSLFTIPPCCQLHTHPIKVRTGKFKSLDLSLHGYLSLHK